MSVRFHAGQPARCKRARRTVAGPRDWPPPRAAMASVEPVQDGCNQDQRAVHVRSGSEFGAGLRYAIEKGWLELHESGTYVRLLAPGEDLLGRSVDQRGRQPSGQARAESNSQIRQ